MFYMVSDGVDKNRIIGINTYWKRHKLKKLPQNIALLP